jgi:DNA-binding CsgD family transcriptional regulator
MPDRNRKFNPAVIKEPSPSLPVNSDNHFAIRILTQPSLFVVDIVKSPNAPFAVYTRDPLGRFLFLSPSARVILDRALNELLEFSLLECLSDSLCNQKIRNLWSPQSNEENNSFSIEILGIQGALIRLDVTETAVISENRIIGFVGFIKRSDHPDHNHMPDFEIDDRELMQRVASLSNVERQVAELVVDGHMNKRMANLLDVAVRTIETRRARVMSKMRAKSLPQLVQMWLRVRQIESEAGSSGDSD